MASSTSIDAQRRQRAQDLYLMGRALVKSGDQAQAALVLRRALDEDRNVSDAWVWLAATTDDPAEQKQHLDWAIAADPANMAARRWLALLSGHLQPKDLQPSDATPARPSEPQDAATQRTFTCRQCGGGLRFDPETADLQCRQCGAFEDVVETSTLDQARIFDHALPTRAGHAWAAAQRRQTCQQCGAATIFPAGQTSIQCPFCGAEAFIAAPEDAALISPQSLLPMRLEAERAQALLKEWLGRGFFAPDDLVNLSRHPRLHPAYLPFWIFNFDVTVHWQALVSSGSGRNQRWEWRKDQRTFFIKDFLQPGVRSLPLALFRQAEPFDLAALVDHQPEYLAGWPAVTYDLSLADAAIQARGETARHSDQQTRQRAASGRALRNFQISGHDFTGETFRLALLPLWLGTYHYDGKAFQVLINGQTGKVAGRKPLDYLKVAAVTVAVVLVLLVAAIGLTLLARGWGA